MHWAIRDRNREPRDAPDDAGDDAEASADRVGVLLDYYAGLAGDRERPERVAKCPVDYYLDPDEPAGRWWGSGRAALGVGAEVEGGELRALLEARHPTTGEKLGRGFGESSTRGFDATFSAPKSVSALWALTPDPWVRAEVLAAHDATLGWFEDHGAVTRRGTKLILRRDLCYSVVVSSQFSPFSSHSTIFGPRSAMAPSKPPVARSSSSTQP